MESLKYGASILSANFASLGQEVRFLDATSIDYIHLDVMDGHFVPNITIGPAMVAALRSETKKVFDVHLMIKEPSRHLEAFVKAGADIITVHREVASSDPKSLRDILQHLRTCGVKASLAYHPDTPLDDLEVYMPYVDQVLIMSVVPGFGGQAFLPDALERGRYAHDMIKASSYAIDLQIDGGVNLRWARPIKDAGFNVLIAGHFLYAENALRQNLQALQDA